MYLVKMARWQDIALSVINRKLNFETQPRQYQNTNINHIGRYKIESYFKQQPRKIIIKWKIVVMCC